MVAAWGTREMIEFRESWIPAHKVACAAKQWEPFWVKFFAAWFIRFPETDVEIPGQKPIRKVSVSC